VTSVLVMQLLPFSYERKAVVCGDYCREDDPGGSCGLPPGSIRRAPSLIDI